MWMCGVQLDMSKEEPKYDLQKIVRASHLPNTLYTISRMLGAGIPDDKTQFFVNTMYRVDPEKRNSPQDAGIRRTGGFSIQIQDIDNLCAELQDVKKSILAENDKHYFVCTACTISKDKIIFHKKQNADDGDICPRSNNAEQQPENSVYMID